MGPRRTVVTGGALAHSRKVIGLPAEEYHHGIDVQSCSLLKNPSHLRPTGSVKGCCLRGTPAGDSLRLHGRKHSWRLPCWKSQGRDGPLAPGTASRFLDGCLSAQHAKTRPLQFECRRTGSIAGYQSRAAACRRALPWPKAKAMAMAMAEGVESAQKKERAIAGRFRSPLQRSSAATLMATLNAPRLDEVPDRGAHYLVRDKSDAEALHRIRQRVQASFSNARLDAASPPEPVPSLIRCYPRQINTASIST